MLKISQCFVGRHELQVNSILQYIVKAHKNKMKQVWDVMPTFFNYTATSAIQSGRKAVLNIISILKMVFQSYFFVVKCQYPCLKKKFCF